MKAKIDNTQPNCRLGGERVETVNYIISKHSGNKRRYMTGLEKWPIGNCARAHALTILPNAIY